MQYELIFDAFDLNWVEKKLVENKKNVYLFFRIEPAFSLIGNHITLDHITHFIKYSIY